MRAVHFGAGNIGRGFIGLLLSRSGYEVVFVDVNDQLVHSLQERRDYPVMLADGQGHTEWVRGVTAIHGSHTDEVAAAIAAADLVTTAVGVSVLPHIASSIAAGIRLRLDSSDAPLNIIACENTIGGSSKLQTVVYDSLTEEERRQADGRIAFPNAAVDRIVPLQKHEDMLQVTVEPFYEWVVEQTAILGGRPEIAGIHYVDTLEPYIARKLFTVNTGHCSAAYLGYLRGYETIQQAMADEWIVAQVRGTMEETGEILCRKYGFERKEHATYMNKILERFTNPYLSDDVCRVGRAPIRKLSPEDRFVKPLLLAHEFGIDAGHLITTIVAALQFDHQGDAEAVELQHALHEQGVRKVVVDVLGIPESHPLHAEIARQYEEQTQITIRLTGIAAAPGYAIAKALVLNKDQYVPERVTVPNSSEEQARFERAVSASSSELESLRQTTLEKLGADKAEIFAGHLLLLRDPELIDAIIENIGQQGINAEFALYEVTQMFIDMFMTMDNELLRARAADIRDVTERIMNHLRGIPHPDLAAIDEDCVIIARDLSPSDTARFNREVVKGILCAEGSRTSHTAIMARSLEIPAIVGAGEGVLGISAGSHVILDAFEGAILAYPSRVQIAAYREEQWQYELRKEQLSKLRDLPTCSVDGHRVELAANIGKLEDLQKVLDSGAEGIGLFRTEFLYMNRNGLPTEEEQFNMYKHVLEKMDDKPVVIRTLDIGGDKELPYMNLPKENNPFLGQRALRLCLSREELFRTQLRALLRAGVYGNLKIMFPMIAVLEEWLEAKAILLEEKEKLQIRGVAVPERLEIGMMVEVPAAALSAEIFAAEVDFFSIGTNDLIQYTMAADRMNESVSYLYQPCHPSLLKLIRMVIEAANKHGKWVGMCGEMAGDLASIPLLLGLGLHEFSMSAASILPARELIGRLNYGKLVSVAAHTLTLRSQGEVHGYLTDTMSAKEEVR